MVLHFKRTMKKLENICLFIGLLSASPHGKAHSEYWAEWVNSQIEWLRTSDIKEMLEAHSNKSLHYDFIETIGTWLI
jgi:hypothetical protein